MKRNTRLRNVALAGLAAIGFILVTGGLNSLALGQEVQKRAPVSTPIPGSAATGEPDRTLLPLAEPTYPPITELDARKATPPPRFVPKAPRGAPNVLVILLDNLGYGATKTFGGVINMPTLERLAKNGLIYNNFHTTPLCSPSRMALLTGRNAHSANMGSVAEIATAFPGQTAERPLSVAPLAEVLKLNGYSTAMFGKTHEFTPWETERFRDRLNHGLRVPDLKDFTARCRPKLIYLRLSSLTIQPWSICRMTPTITTQLISPTMPSPGCAPRKP